MHQLLTINVAPDTPEYFENDAISFIVYNDRNFLIRKPFPEELPETISNADKENSWMLVRKINEHEHERLLIPFNCPPPPNVEIVLHAFYDEIQSWKKSGKRELKISNVNNRIMKMMEGK